VSTERFQRIAAIFLEARSVPPDEREAWLAARAGGDEDLANQVRLMLDAGGDEAALPTSGAEPYPAAALDGPITPAETFQAPETVGPYRILEPIGEGGFGVVFAAEQRIPVRRRVALKLMRRGLDSERFVARFEAERQAVAMMTHPNVARIHDAGTTADGRPWFTMELVQGRPITEHCDRARLSIEQRLELFIPVCEGLQHAHQKGLIHRDVKPSNVLVAMQEGVATPKLIDFGVAKAIGGGLTDRTIYTAHDQLIGTPEYMSPEQADGSTTLVDVRSDVYSLGVLLFELLVGSTPLDGHALRTGGISEMRRRIATAATVRPSQRLASSPEQAAAIARARSTDGASLLTALRGDLDWIVLRCLQPEIDRRYESARALQRDLERLLAHEAIVARPPSTVYQVRKFVRRHRTLVGSAALLALSLGLGAAGIVHRSIDLAAERDAAEAAQLTADRSRRTAEAVTGVLARMIGGVSPDVARGRDTALLEGLIEDALIDAERTLANEPEAFAEIQVTLGSALNRMGRMADAIPLLEQAERTFAEVGGPTDERRLHAMLDLSLAALRLDDLEAARRWSSKAFELGLALNPTGPIVLTGLVRYGQVLQDEARFEELEAVLDEHQAALEAASDPDHPDVIALTTMRAVTHLELGRPIEAAELYEAAVVRLRRVLGDDHPQTIRTIGNAARARNFMGDYATAETFARDALESATRVLGPDHPDTLIMSGTLANALRDQRKFEEALELYEALIEQRGRVYGMRSTQQLVTVNNMASLLYAIGEHKRAEPYFREVIDGWSATRGDDHPHVLIARSNLADVLHELDRATEAEAIQAGVVEGFRASMPEGHWWIGAALAKHGGMLISIGRMEEGEAALLEAYRTLVTVPGEGRRRAATAAEALAGYYERTGRPDEAERWWSRFEEHRPPEPG